MVKRKRSTSVSGELGASWLVGRFDHYFCFNLLIRYDTLDFDSSTVKKVGVIGRHGSVHLLKLLQA